MARKKKEEVELDEEGNPIVEIEDETKSKLDSVIFQDLLKVLSKDIGANLILKASDERVNEFPVIPTGIFQLDYALGGGIPIGQIAEFFGPYSSMKTSLILKIIGNAQKQCATCWVHRDIHGNEGSKSCEKFTKVTTAFLDVEKSFNGKWAATLGVNCDDVQLFQPPYAEKAIDMADQLLRSGCIDILVLDSLAALVPMKEIERSAEDQMMGAQAKLIGTMCRKTQAAMVDIQKERGRAPTVFWTNQLREKITMFGPPEKQSGGEAFKFFVSTMVRLEKGNGVFESEKEKEQAPLYVPIKFKVVKNKMGVPLMEGEFRLVTTETDDKKVGNIYDENKIMDIAEKVGLYVKTEGKMSWYFDGELIGNSKSLFERRLLTDPDFSKKVRTTLMNKLLKK